MICYFLLSQFQCNPEDEMAMSKVMEIVHSVSASCLKIISLQGETDATIDVKDNDCHHDHCDDACNSIKKSFRLLDNKLGMKIIGMMMLVMIIIFVVHFLGFLMQTLMMMMAIGTTMKIVCSAHFHCKHCIFHQGMC